MRITPISPQSFKSHYYGISPNNFVFDIKIDSNLALGKEPYLVSSSGECKFEKDDVDKDKFIARVYSEDKNPSYYIKYKDTGNIDLKNGEKYTIPKKSLENIGYIYSLKTHRQPITQSIKNGVVIGKLLYMDNLDELLIKNIKEPTIIVTDKLSPNILNNQNIVGVCLIKTPLVALSHIGASIRSSTNASFTSFDENLIKKLKALDGKNIEMKVQNNNVEYKVTNKFAKKKCYPVINVPKLKYSDKILQSSEYTPDLVGAKAVNLRRLEELVDDGKIDVIIPKSVTLPYGYVEKLKKCGEESDNIKEMQKIVDVLRENSIDTDYIMVRSAFNGEDLDGYSAAGIYDSFLVSLTDAFNIEPLEMLSSSIDNVIMSKNNQRAKKSRKKYHIPDEAIKPSVILQEYIKSDHKFTVYTEYDKDKLRIEMFSRSSSGIDSCTVPHIFTYNKKSGKLSYDSIQLRKNKVWFDDNLNLIPNKKIEEDLSENKEVVKLIKKLVKNVLIIEKEFGAPQDIEGGFKDNNIYLWQTRNIVN